MQRRCPSAALVGPARLEGVRLLFAGPSEARGFDPVILDDAVAFTAAWVRG